MALVRLAALDDLELDLPLRVELSTEEAVVLIRTAGGVSALEDRCSHEDYPLSEGFVEDGCIECTLHGSRFDLVTGEPDTLPATRPVPVYDVRLSDGGVLVDLPEDKALLAQGVARADG